MTQSTTSLSSEGFMIDFIKLGFVAAAVCMSVTAAQAAPIASAAGSCGKQVGGLLDTDDSFVVSCPGGSWIDPRPGAASSASWSASVVAGQFRATASATVDTTPPLGQSTPLALGVTATADASLSDELLFDAPGLPAGTPATMSFTMLIEGNMNAINSSAQAASSARWNLYANTVSNGRSLGSAGDGSKLENFYDWGVTGNPTVDALYGFELPVVIGQTVTFSLTLEARAGASGWRSGSPGSIEYLTPVQSAAVSDLGNTALWHGITSLTLQDGTPLQNWTVTASSGFDYTRPVPEPGAWALSAAGLATLAALNRRRGPAHWLSR